MTHTHKGMLFGQMQSYVLLHLVVPTVTYECVSIGSASHG